MTRRKWCARDECREPVGPPSRRFCDTHRRAHGQALLAQLAAVERQVSHVGTQNSTSRPPEAPPINPAGMAPAVIRSVGNVISWEGRYWRWSGTDWAPVG